MSVLFISILVVAAACVVTIGVLHARQRQQHHATVRQLLDLADLLQADLKECRDRLDRAHAMMEVTPGEPVSGEADARRAVDAGLRALLGHRLWIRDESPRASQRELDAAVTAMARARASLEPQLRVLDCAQRELEQAVREQVQRN